MVPRGMCGQRWLKAEVQPAPLDAAATVEQLRNHASSSCIRCGTKRGFLFWVFCFLFFSFLFLFFFSFFFSLFEGFCMQTCGSGVRMVRKRLTFIGCEKSKFWFSFVFFSLFFSFFSFSRWMIYQVKGFKGSFERLEFKQKVFHT